MCRIARVIDDEDWLTLADAFHAAAVDGEGWYEALAGLAQATGSQHGQLVCMTDRGDSLNLLTNVDPTLPKAFVEAGGTDPRVNPRRRAGLAHPPLSIIAEADFISPDDVKRDTHYQEFAVPWDVPYICLTTLERRRDLLVGLSVIRSRRQGHIDEAGKRIFTSIAPHVRAAVRTSMTLGNQRAALLTDTFEKLGLAAFICDQAGNVLRLTPSAEKLCAPGTGLQLRRGKIGASRPAEHAALETAVRVISERKAGNEPQTVVIHAGGSGVAPLTIDVMPLPRQRLELRFDARALLVVRAEPGNERRRSAALRDNYGFTPAEIEIALALTRGMKVSAIASARGVAVGTVRVQIKSLLAKAGVNRQVELVARITRI
jgi:DNA-binding CsgD family transcriptional regulator